MYIIINNTTRKTSYVKGSFPNVEKHLNEGHDLIVVSLYSNTIKIPIPLEIYDDNGHNTYDWVEYRMELLEVIDNHLKNQTLLKNLI